MKKKGDLWFLHLSDFHIGDPTAKKDFLRSGHYKELIKGFATKVLSTLSTEKLAGIIFTGDLIDKGNVGKLSLAKELIDHLCEKLAIGKENFIACHGNHDFDLNAANKSYAQAIKPITDLFAHYAKAKTDCQSPLGSLYKISSSAYVLILDSLLNPRPGRAGDPGGEPSITHADAIVEMVDKNVKDDDILIVASHYPLSDFQEIDDVQDRLWTAGRELANRIASIREYSKGANLWLSGDLHLATKPRSSNGFTCILGCHLDGRPVRTKQAAGAILIRVRQGTSIGACASIELRQAAHKQKASGGHWQLSEWLKFSSDLTSRNHARFKNEKSSTTSRQALLKTTGSANKKNSKSDASVPIECFGDSIKNVTGGAPELDVKILQTVASENLYHFGRFNTAKERVSLGWVSVGPLLAGTQPRASIYSASTPMLPLVISQMHEWIVQKVAVFRLPQKADSVVMLGIDSWGAIISSQISIMTGWRNFCIGGRGDGVHHTTFESITPRVIREVRSASVVIFITDVIASGNTLNKLYKKISNDINPQNKMKRSGRSSRKWLAAAVLCDELTDRGHELNFLEVVGCSCKSLRLPLIAPEQLPSKQILQEKLHFTTE